MCRPTKLMLSIFLQATPYSIRSAAATPSSIRSAATIRHNTPIAHQGFVTTSPVHRARSISPSFVTPNVFQPRAVSPSPQTPSVSCLLRQGHVTSHLILIHSLVAIMYRYQRGLSILGPVISGLPGQELHPHSGSPEGKQPEEKGESRGKHFCVDN